MSDIPYFFDEHNCQQSEKKPIDELLETIISEENLNPIPFYRNLIEQQETVEQKIITAERSIRQIVRAHESHEYVEPDCFYHRPKREKAKGFNRSEVLNTYLKKLAALERYFYSQRPHLSMKLMIQILLQNNVNAPIEILPLIASAIRNWMLFLDLFRESKPRVSNTLEILRQYNCSAQNASNLHNDLYNYYLDAKSKMGVEENELV